MNLLIVFVRAPIPGRVKSRLAAVLGPEAACAAYQRLVSELVSNLSSLPEVEFRFTPPGAETLVSEWLQPGWTAKAQSDGELGERMANAFLDAFGSGATRVVLIGSDAPEVKAEDVQRAWTELEHSEVVLGPALDGGYWLIGLRTNQPALFQNVAWGTNTVLTDTIARARTGGLGVVLLRRLADIDTAEDWLAYLRRSNGDQSNLTKNQGGA